MGRFNYIAMEIESLKEPYQENLPGVDFVQRELKVGDRLPSNAIFFAKKRIQLSMIAAKENIKQAEINNS